MKEEAPPAEKQPSRTAPDRRTVIICVTLGTVVALVAAALPSDSILDSLAARFNTVRDFRIDFERGLQLFRIALWLNALLLAGLPWILSRCRIEEGEEDPSPGEWALPALLPLLTLAVSAIGLGTSFQSDEYRSLTEYIRHGPLVCLTRSVDADNHVLYSLLAWPFVKLLGMTEFALRLPSWIITSLAPYFLYRIVRRSASSWVSFLVCLPFAASPFLVQWAYEGRGYGSIMTFLLALAWLQPRMLRSRSLRPWAWYCLLGTLAVYMHVFTSVALISLTAGALLLRGGRSGPALYRNLSALGISGCLALLLYSPILFQYFGYSSKQSTPASWPPLYDLLPSAFIIPLEAWWVLPFAIAAGIGVFRSKQIRASLFALPIFVVLMTVLILISGAGKSLRFYTPAIALAWIPIALGLTLAFQRKALGAALLIALLIPTAWAEVSLYRLGKPDFRGALHEVQKRSTKGEQLAITSDCRSMSGYSKKKIPVLEEAALMKLLPEWVVIIDTNLRKSARLSEWLDRHYRIDFRLPSTSGELRGYHIRK